MFGERGKEGYQDIGLDESSLRITGNPAWDDYPQLRKQRAQIRSRMALQHGLSPELPIVVFGTTWAANLTAFSDEGIHGKTLQIFLAAAKQLIQSRDDAAGGGERPPWGAQDRSRSNVAAGQ